MAEEHLGKLLKTRKELEQFSEELQDVAETLEQATREEDPVPLDVFHMKTINSQLDSLRGKITDSLSVITRNETDNAAKEEDGRNRAKLLTEWDRLKHCALSLSNVYKAEKIAANIHNSIKRLETKQAENPTKIYTEALHRLDPQMTEFRERLNSTNLPSDHSLWISYEDFEDRIDSMLAYEAAPPDVKVMRKVHEKGSYKISALAIPKFNGKIQNWVSFWQEFNYAVHKKTDIDDAVKMVYLKQAITDPGLNTTISDLGIEEGSYSAAVKVLHDRYDKPRVMHRLFCESLRYLKPSNNSKASLSEMADQAQHILLGLTRLKSLGASEVITSLVESAMSSELKEHWLNHTSSLKTTPPAEKMIEFLRMRADRAEGVGATGSHKSMFEKSKSNKSYKKNKGIAAAASPTATPAVVTSPTGPSVASVGAPAVVSQTVKREYPPCKYSCPICPENHYVFHCNTFKGYSIKQRKEHVVAHSLCSNCLKPGHALEACRSTFRCFTCKAKHSSLLHEDSAALSSPALGLASASAIIPDGLLMTANVLITGTNGITVTARAFIDGGSSVTLITNKLKKALALKPTGGSLSIDGVAGFVGETQNPVVSLTISSPWDKTWERNISAIAMPKVIRDLPLKDASVVKEMPHLQNITLAEPLYHKVGPIDVLLGLNVFPHIFKPGIIEGPPNAPVAWHTVFGWTVLGVFKKEGSSQAITASTFIVEPTQAHQASDQLLTRFWRMEEPQNYDRLLSPEEQRVEDHFEKTHKYLKEEKRYMVSLPRTLGDLSL